MAENTETNSYPEPVREILASTQARVANVSKREAFDVYVGRSGRGRTNTGWGNPFRLDANTERARAESVATYAAMLAENQTLQDRLHELAGRTLGCWCSPKLCHAHVLAHATEHGTASLDSLSETLRGWAGTQPRRILVTGSRSWSDEAAVRTALHEAWRRHGERKDTVLVVGDAAGADSIAARQWTAQHLPVELHEAQWETHGRKAGMVRNAQMVRSGADDCLAFWDGQSPGTEQMLQLVRRAGITVELHRS